MRARAAAWMRWTVISERRRAASAFQTRPEVAFHPAFTLLELLVAIAITAVLVGFIVILVANVSGFWTRSSGRLSAEAQARYILDQLTLDLQAAIFRDVNGVALAADVLTDTGNSGLWNLEGEARQKPSDAAGTALRYDANEIGDATFGRAGVWLRLFTNQRGSNTSPETLSAPVALGWQLVRRDGTSGDANRNPRYFLHRAVMSPTQVLDAGFDLAAAPYASAASPLRRPPVESIVGENVIDFGVRFFAYDANGALVRIFPHADERSHHAVSPPGAGAPATQFPALIDVMVRILTEEGARLIANLEADPPRVPRPAEFASDAEYWWSLALAHSYVFTRRIALPGRGPSS